MKKYNVYLRSFSKTLLNNKIKQTVFFYEMNLTSDLYHRKIEQKLYTDSWQNQFETKNPPKKPERLSASSGSDTGLPENKRIHLVSVRGNAAFPSKGFSFILVDARWRKYYF